MSILRANARTRDALRVVAPLIESQPVSTGKSVAIVTSSRGVPTVTNYNLNAKALLDAIAAQTVGVAGPARTITRAADGTLTIV